MKNMNGTGTIFKLSGNRRRPYVAKAPAIYADDSAIPLQKVIGYYKTKKEALIALGEYLRAPYNLDATTIDNLIDKVIIHAKLSPTTATNYTSYYKKHLQPFIGRVKASELKLAHVQNVLDNLPDSNHGVLSVARLIAKYLVEFEYITRPFAEFLTMPKSEKHMIKTVYSRDEIKNIFDKYKNDNDIFAKVFLIYLFTGFRMNELLKADKSVYHTDPLPYFQSGIKTAAGENRIVPIHPIILPIVKEFLSNDSDYFFPPDARHLLVAGGTRDRNFKKYFANKHCLHETRHTFRTELDKVESNVTTINKLMGHSGGHIGQRIYTHKSIEELYQTILKLDYGLVSG